MRLATIALSGIGGNIFSAVKSVLINPFRVNSVLTQTDYVHVKYAKQNQQEVWDLLTLTTEANINTELNTANATTPAELSIVLDILNLESGASEGSFSVNTGTIVWVEEFSGDATQSLVTIALDNYSSSTYRVDHTVAAIKALANA